MIQDQYFNFYNPVEHSSSKSFANREKIYINRKGVIKCLLISTFLCNFGIKVEGSFPLSMTSERERDENG